MTTRVALQTAIVRAIGVLSQPRSWKATQTVSAVPTEAAKIVR
jgi:hypothetical protein